MPGKRAPVQEVKRRAFEVDDSILLDPSMAVDGRFVHIDVTRICCIACVVLTKLDGRYALVNELCGWQWVLQVLWLLCGVCFGLSERSFVGYASRLVKYLVIGLLVNWTAYVLQGFVWQSHVLMLPVQMMFVFVLLLVTTILAPIKTYWLVDGTLDERLPLTGAQESSSISSRRDHFLQTLMIVGAGLVTFLILGFVTRPMVADFAEVLHKQFSTSQLNDVVVGDSLALFAEEIVNQIEVCLAALWLVAVCPQLFDKSLLVWVLIAHFNLHRAFLGLWRSNLFCDAFCLVLIATVAVRFGMAKRCQLGRMVHRYWFLVCFLGGAMWAPGYPGTNGAYLVKSTGIISEIEADSVRMIKHFGAETLLSLAWLTAGQTMVDPKIFSVDGLSWVNEWALLAFLLQTALWLLFGQPMSTVILLAMGPVCWAAHSYLSRRT